MEIKEKIKTIPNKPGCYLYFNSQNKVIYVGKAKDLKKRVASYFKVAQNIKTTRLVREIVDVQIIITNNEKEALLLEENLIKKYKPRFNVVLNDDRHYPYIVITNESDPEYQYVRHYNKKFKRSFGPLPDGTSASKILKTLQLLYPLRRCKGNLGKPCIYFGIEQCSGACFKIVDDRYYTEILKKVDSFFRGHSDEVKQQLAIKMNRAAENLQFEEAGRIKSILQHLNLALFKQDVELKAQDDVDVFNWFTIDNHICFVVLFYLNGKLSFKDYIVFEYDEQDIGELLSSYVMQIYSKNIIPKKIILPEAFDDLDLNLLYENAVEKNDKKYHALLQLAKKNAEETLKMSLMQSTTFVDKTQKILSKIQSKLMLPTYPSHIEMFDVANLYNEFVTGAMVVFKNGQPSKNDFRKFNIDIEQQDDYHRMREMIYRRYQKDLFLKANLPDLIIMDGGVIQVHAAKTELSNLGLNIPVIGLIKDNHHRTNRLLNWDETELEIKNDLELFNFFGNIQERVHTFAISGFRARKEKGIFSNEFDQIKGIGPKTIKSLATSFDSLVAIRSASLEELEEKIKNKKNAEKIYQFIHEKLENVPK